MKQKTKEFIQRTKSYLIECKRVLKVTKKPTPFEFKSIVKISGLGILVIGMIGFIINMVKQLIFG